MSRYKEGGAKSAHEFALKGSACSFPLSGGQQAYQIVIRSGSHWTTARRCDTHNHEVSTAKNKKNGVHTLGQASDILIFGPRAMVLFEKARQIGFSGIGLAQRGPHKDRFVHLDTKPRVALCSY